jgi:hypothetical protein
VSAPAGDGPTINGRPILTIAEVQQWARDAHAPITPSSANLLTQELNAAAFEAAAILTRNAGPTAKWLAEVSADLTRLRENLSKGVADTRRIDPTADTSLTDQLLDLIDKHSGLIIAKRGVGKPRDARTRLRENIGNLFHKVRKDEQLSQPTAKSKVACFAEQAANWVLDDPLVQRLATGRAASAASIQRQGRRKQKRT